METYLSAIGISVIRRSANYFLEVEGQKKPPRNHSHISKMGACNMGFALDCKTHSGVVLCRHQNSGVSDCVAMEVYPVS